jgi:hypothetical protein
MVHIEEGLIEHGLSRIRYAKVPQRGNAVVRGILALHDFLSS